ncbi:transposase [Liquorilactobacillus nagelii]
MTFNFNKNICGQLSSNGGLTLCEDLMIKFQFIDLAEKLLKFDDQRKCCQHSNSSILKQLVLQIIAGYSTDSAETFFDRRAAF